MKRLTATRPHFRARPWFRELAMVACLAAGAAGPVSADHQVIRWQNLSVLRQDVMQPLSGHRESLAPARQWHLASDNRRRAEISPEERARMRQRAERWRNMSPDQRERIRKRYERFRALPEADRERIKQARKRFRNLPPEERERLRRRWRDMSPRERQRFIDSQRAGDGSPDARAWQEPRSQPRRR